MKFLQAKFLKISSAIVILSPISIALSCSSQNNEYQVSTSDDILYSTIWNLSGANEIQNSFFNLTIEDVTYTDICPLLNIPLNWEGGPRTKNTPSLDRIIPEKGYVKGNIRIISNLANMMKSYASNEELRTFAKNINVYMENEDIVRPTENTESVELEDKEPLS